jgi:hypothetical protein
MFSLPVGENDVHDGSTKSQPLRLEGITISDFKPFVDLMNPGLVCFLFLRSRRNLKHYPLTWPRALPEIKFSLTEWTSILKLSTMWEFTGIRQYAIAQIPKLGISSAERIYLAREYHIQDWLLPGLVAYAQQEDSITAFDVRLLGWEFVLKLLQARERMGNFTFQTSPYMIGTSLYSPGIKARVTHDFTKAMEEAFRGEIERVLQMYPG